MSDVSQLYYFLLLVSTPDYSHSECSYFEFVVIEMEIVQNSKYNLYPWGINTFSDAKEPPVIANSCGGSEYWWTRCTAKDLFKWVNGRSELGNFLVPFFCKSDTNGYSYNFVVKVKDVYLAVIAPNFDSDRWDLDLLNVNGPLIHQLIGEYARDTENTNIFKFLTYDADSNNKDGTDKNGYKSLNIPSLSYLLDNINSENFYNHEFSIIRSNLYVY